MSSWPEYDNMSTDRRNSKKYKKRIQKRTKLFEDSQKSIKLADELETQDRRKAVMAYKKLRATRNPSNDKDIALYHCDKRIQLN